MTTATAAPAVLAAVKTLWATALGSTAQVFQGYGISSDPKRATLMVGVEDPFGQGAAVSYNGDAEWAYASTVTREEDATILSSLYVKNGSTDLQAVLTDLTTALNAMFTAVINDPTLGIAYVLWSLPRIVSINHDQTPKGCEALAVISLRYRAHLVN